MQRKPVIGLTLDYEETDGYSQYPWYAMRHNYMRVIADLGATPIALPHEPDCVAHYINIIDGLLVTGGRFDIAPNLYGDTQVHNAVETKEKRTQFEWEIATQALKANMPLLGICGGEQLLNVVLGGSLVQYIPDEIAGAINHRQDEKRHLPTHDIYIAEGSLLHKIAGVSETVVNSSHQQSVKTPGKGVIVNAKAPDGVIEGIEVPDRDFCLGVQWHPEFLLSKTDHNIFEHFIQAAKKYKTS